MSSKYSQWTIEPNLNKPETEKKLFLSTRNSNWTTVYKEENA